MTNTDDLIAELKRRADTREAIADRWVYTQAADALVASEARAVAAEAKNAAALAFMSDPTHWSSNWWAVEGRTQLEDILDGAAPLAPAPTDERDALIESLDYSRRRGLGGMTERGAQEHMADAILDAGFHRTVPSEATTDETTEWAEEWDHEETGQPNGIGEIEPSDSREWFHDGRVTHRRRVLTKFGPWLPVAVEGITQ